MEEPTFKTFGEFTFHRSQKVRFKSGELWKQWYEQYPNLFDEKTLEWFQNQAKYGYHFVEALATIILHTSTGYLPLTANEYRTNPKNRKTDLLDKIVTPETSSLIENCIKLYHVQCPDILMYKPDCSDYFFCEVKGPGDKLSEKQMIFYRELEKISGKTVYIVRFREKKK